MLELENLSKRYGARVAADGLSLRLGAGEILALLGPSGGGKSTLLKMIAGLAAPDAGRVLWQGEDIGRLPPQRRGFALVFQDFALFPHLDVLGNVMFGLIEQRVLRIEARQIAEAELSRLGLPPADYAKRRVWTLSGGEQQRVALARALATRPRLLLLDEPFSSLDAHLRGRLREECRALLQEAGIPAILVTHDRDEAFAMADRVAVLRDGRIVQCDTPQRLLAAPADAWLARFIGHDNVRDDALLPQQALRLGADQPPATVLAVQALADGVVVAVAAQAGELTLRLSAREAAQYADQLYAGGELGVGVAEAECRRWS